MYKLDLAIGKICVPKVNLGFHKLERNRQTDGHTERCGLKMLPRCMLG